MLQIIVRYACVAVCIVAFVMLINSLFSLQTVEVVGQDITIELNKKLLHTNLLFIPLDQVRKQLLKDYVLLSDVEIQKKYPHTIRIIPKLRLPIARLYTRDRIVIVDKEGWVVGDVQSQATLPSLEFDIAHVFTGMKIQDARVLASLTFLSALPYDMQIERITIHDNASLRATSDRIDIYIPHAADMKKIATTLQTLRTGFRIKGKLPVIIDLRFDKPVVTF